VLKPQSRLLTLDVLRVVAVLLVIGHHVRLPTDAHPLLRAWHRGGWVGVDLFFVLSGFLVSGLLFREHLKYGTIRVGRFLLRRGLKIYPAFYCFLLATLVVLHFRTGDPAATRITGEVLFVQNYLGGVWNHTWSLAVEEHFYLGIALLAVAFAGRRRGNPFGGMVVVLLGLAGVALACRIGRSTLPYSSLTHLYPTHLRADSLGFGVILSYFYHFHHERFVARLKPLRHGLFLTGMVGLVPSFLWPLGSAPLLQTVGLTLLYLAWGLILVALLLSEVPSSLPWRAVGQVGAYSYSIYLWHMPVLVWALPVLESSLGTHFAPLPQLVLALAGSTVVGIAAALLIEVPVLHLRDRLFPSGELAGSGRGRVRLALTRQENSLRVPARSSGPRDRFCPRDAQKLA
jgi:peptidoglycan/LPS O-acetylase OafA/YrhL